MGLRGPAPEPTQLKRLKGNPGHRPLGELEPQPPALDTIAPPVHLSVGARRVWEKHAPALAATKVLTQADVAAFSLICRLEDECEGLAKTLKEAMKDASARYRHPLDQGLMERRTMLVKLWAEFGMTPSSRTRLKVEPRKPEDPADEFRAAGRVN